MFLSLLSEVRSWHNATFTWTAHRATDKQASGTQDAKSFSAAYVSSGGHQQAFGSSSDCALGCQQHDKHAPNRLKLFQRVQQNGPVCPAVGSSVEWFVCARLRLRRCHAAGTTRCRPCMRVESPSNRAASLRLLQNPRKAETAAHAPTRSRRRSRIVWDDWVTAEG